MYVDQQGYLDWVFREKLIEEVAFELRTNAKRAMQQLKFFKE